MTRWLGRLSAAFLLAAVAAGFAANAPTDFHGRKAGPGWLNLVSMAQAQTGQSGGCPLNMAAKISSATSYKVSSADKCDLVVLTNTGAISVQLPAPGLIFAPGFRVKFLALNGGTITFSGLPDQSGTVHKINLNSTLTLSSSSSAELQVLQDNNWWAVTSGTALNRYPIIAYPSAAWSSDPTNANAWVFVPPAGMSIPSLVGTQSQGWAEVFAAAETAGKSIEAACSGENYLLSPDGSHPNGRTTQYEFISSAAALNPGNLSQRFIHINGCNLTFAAALTGAHMTIDTTLDGGEFIFPGQIVGLNNAPTDSTFTVLLKPSKAPGAEGVEARVIQNGRIYIGAVVGGVSQGAPPAGAVVGVDNSVGSVSSMVEITIGEINGCGPCQNPVFHDGLRTFGGSTTRGFFRNPVKVGYIHNIVIGIDNGSTDNTDPANPKAYNNNDFEVASISPGSTSGQCFIDSGSYNRWHIKSCNNDTLSAQGGLQYLAVGTLTAEAHFASVDVNALGYSQTISTVAGASTPFPFIDAGTGTTLRLGGQDVQRFMGVDRGSAQSIGAQESYLPVASVSSGSGATAVATPTNSVGQLSVGTGNPVTATINFAKAPGASHAFQRAPGCVLGSNQGLIFETNSTQDSVTGTSSVAMPQGTIITWFCRGIP